MRPRDVGALFGNARATISAGSGIGRRGALAGCPGCDLARSGFAAQERQVGDDARERFIGARSVRVRVDGGVPVVVLWVRRSETNRPSKCLEDTRGELARKGLTHRRMSNDSPKIEWSCQRVNEQVGVGIPRQFPGRDGLLDPV